MLCQKLRFFRRQGMVLSAAVFIHGCGEKNEDKTAIQLKSEVPATNRDYAMLGQAYHKDKMNFLNVNCVDGEKIETLGNTHAELSLQMDLSFSQLLDHLGGRLSVDTNFPVVRAGAEANYARDAAATEYANTFHFNWTITPKKIVLANNTYRLSPIGERYAKNPDKLLEKCGDEFLTAIEYGGSLDVDLKIEYRNQKDKKDISGKIQVGVGEGIDIVKVDGSLQYLNEEIKQSVKISVRAQQKGGEPLKLLGILPDNFIVCTLAHPDPCFNVFSKAINYARDNLAEQFSQSDRYNVVKYYTEKYENSGLDDLVPRSIPILSHLVQLAREELEMLFQQTLVDSKRITTLTTSYGQLLSPEQAQKLQDLKKTISTNITLIAKASAYCYDNPYTDCVEYHKDTMAKIVTYDRSILHIDGPKIDDNSRCHNAILYAVKKGFITKNISILYERNHMGPVFENIRHPERGITAWGPCYDVAKSYLYYFDMEVDDETYENT